MKARPSTKSNALYLKALLEAEGRPANLERAFRYLLKAHEQGDPRATYALGTWYLHGKHVQQDRRRGLELIRNAAACNVPEALYDFAYSLESGDGVRMSKQLAAKNYLKAALLGDTDAIFEVGRCFYHGIGVARNRSLAMVFRGAAKEHSKPQDARPKQPGRAAIKAATSSKTKTAKRPLKKRTSKKS